MSAAAQAPSRIEVERAKIEAERERRHAAALERLRRAAPGGHTAAEIAERLRVTDPLATEGGVGATLRELAQEERVHTRAGVWYLGPDPAPVAMLGRSVAEGGPSLAEVVLEVAGGRSSPWFRAELASAVAARGGGRPQAMLAIDALLKTGELEHPHPADTRLQRPKVRTNVEADRLTAALNRNGAGAEPAVGLTTPDGEPAERIATRSGLVPHAAGAPAADTPTDVAYAPTSVGERVAPPALEPVAADSHDDPASAPAAVVSGASTPEPSSPPVHRPGEGAGSGGVSAGASPATEDPGPATPAEERVETGTGDPIPAAPSGSPAEVAPALAGQLVAPPAGRTGQDGPTDAGSPSPAPPAETSRGGTRGERGTLTGDEIVLLREARGWSQCELARQMAARLPGSTVSGIQSGLSGLERGQWTLDSDRWPRGSVWARVLAKVFGLEPDDGPVEPPASRAQQVATRAARLRTAVLSWVADHPGCTVAEVAEQVGCSPEHVRWMIPRLGLLAVKSPGKGSRTLTRLYPPGHAVDRDPCRLCGRIVDGTEVCPACLADSDPLPTSASPEAPRVSTASPPAVSTSADVHPQPQPEPAPAPSEPSSTQHLSCAAPTVAGVTWWPTVMQHNCGAEGCDAPATRTYSRGGWRSHRCDAHPLTDESSTSRPPAEEPGGRGAPPPAGGDVLEPSAPEVVEVAPARPAPAAAVLAADLSAQLAVEREDLADYRRAHAELEAELAKFDRWLDLLGVPRAPEGEDRGWRRGWAHARMGVDLG